MLFRTGLAGCTSFFLTEVFLLFWQINDFSVTIPTCYKDVYVNSIFPRTAARLSGLLCLQNAFLWPMILVALSLELTDIF